MAGRESCPKEGALFFAAHTCELPLRLTWQHPTEETPVLAIDIEYAVTETPTAELHDIDSSKAVLLEGTETRGREISFNASLPCLDRHERISHNPAGKTFAHTQLAPSTCANLEDWEALP